MVEEFQEDIDELMDDVEPVGDDAESQLYEHFRVVVDKGQAMTRVDRSEERRVGKEC